MLLRCPTDRAVILLGINNSKGVLVFPASSKDQPGIQFRPRPLVPVGLQIIEEINSFLGTFLDGRQIHVVDKYCDTISAPDNEPVSLFVATIRKNPEVCHPDWQTLPDVMRGLPPDRGRLPYLRAWQVLTGSLSLDTKALETGNLLELLPQGLD